MSHRGTLLLAVGVAALLLRLIYLRQISSAPFAALRIGDADVYDAWARRIAAGNWRGDGVFFQAPLYPYFLALVYKTLGDAPSLVRFVQAVIGTLSCVQLAAAGMALFGTRGALAGALLAVYPPAIFMDGLLEKSALVLFCTTAVILLLSVERFRGQPWLVGAALGFLSLTRENALLLAAPIAVWFLGRSGRAAAAFIAGLAVVLLPVGIRNDAVGGEFHLITSQFGPTFYIGNHEGARGLYEPMVSGHASAADESRDAALVANAAAGRMLRPSEVSAFWTARALEFIRTHPGEWIRQLARKLALTINAVEVADTESQEVYAEWSPLLRALSPLGFGIVFALAMGGAVLGAAEWRRLWFLYAIALVYALGLVAFYVFARYRFPIVPVLMMSTAAGVARWNAASRNLKGLAIAATAAAAVVAYLPLEDTRMDRVSHYVNIGHALLKDPDRWREAAAFYEKALREAPDSPAAHFGTGMLMAQMNRPKEAIAQYRIALGGWPANADIHMSLAIALANDADFRGAADALEAAAQLRPADPAPLVLAGKLLLKGARYAEALAACERALVIEATNVDALNVCGISLRELGRSAEAIERHRRAVAINPGDADSHNWLGVALAGERRFAEAIEEFERARAIDPHNAAVQQNLAHAKELLGQQ